MKTYPLELKELRECDGGQFMGYYSKGHHEPATFVTAVQDAQGVTIDPGALSYCWWRVVNDEEFGQMLYHARPFSRGAFPVTYWDEDDSHWIGHEKMHHLTVTQLRDNQWNSIVTFLRNQTGISEEETNACIEAMIRGERSYCFKETTIGEYWLWNHRSCAQRGYPIIGVYQRPLTTEALTMLRLVNHFTYDLIKDWHNNGELPRWYNTFEDNKKAANQAALGGREGVIVSRSNPKSFEW